MQFELYLVKVHLWALAHTLPVAFTYIYFIRIERIYQLEQGESLLNDMHAAYLIVWVIISALLMPVQSFAEPINTVSMLIHNSVSDSFNPQISQQDQKPPLTLATRNGLYEIELTWEPIEIKPNQIVRFDMKIIDSIANRAAENVHYDFAVLKDNQPIKELKNSFLRSGMATHTVEFPASGSFSVIVNVLGIGANVKHDSEFVAFDLKVVPEFPLSTVIVMATLVGITIALTKFTILNKGTGKNITQP